MKLLNEIRFLTVSTIVFMLISMISVSYLYFYSDTPHHLGNKDGLTDTTNVDQPLTATASKGQILFKQNCAKCHYKTDQKSVGPGLKNVMQRINEDQLISWVQNPAETMKRDKYFEKLAEGFNDKMPAFKLSRQEILLIREYIES
jgi:mono/diheme cytochrome c family protein